MKKLPVIIDCDPGHDDAIALIAALASEKLEVLGVTAAAGNQTVEKTEKNARKVLEICARTDIPAARGRTKPLRNPLSVAPEIHGDSGMDGPLLPEPSMPVCKESAAVLIAKLVEESPQPVALIVTGPCTNAAVFLLAYPHLHKKIAKISLMGGGAYLGNRTALAEFNIWTDPEAARIVMESGIPLEVYGLDVTHKAMIYRQEFSLFRQRKETVFQFLADLLDFFGGTYLEARHLPGAPMHDSCAVIGLTNPELFTYRETTISVETESARSRGALTMDLRPGAERQDSVCGKIALDVDREGFLKVLLRACETITRQRREKGYAS